MGDQKSCFKSNIIISIIAIVVAIVTFFLGQQFKKSMIPKAICNIEILSNSRQLNHRYETQALFEIRNPGLLKDDSFYFKIELDGSYEITDVIEKDGFFNEISGKREKNIRAFTAPLWGQRSISGTIIFLSFIPFERKELAHPVKITW